MLEELIQTLTDAIDTGDDKLKEKTFRNLEWVGVDRRSAIILVSRLRQTSGKEFSK